MQQEYCQCVEQNEHREWHDCQKEGHEEGCYVLVCTECMREYPDCKDE
jgi:hypothetical protein